MKYKEIFKERQKCQKKIEDLKSERDLNDKEYLINDKIKLNKFKYKFYNQLLKEKSK